LEDLSWIEKTKNVLRAYAVGDAFGMPTEFMTRKEIVEQFSPLIGELIKPEWSKNHSNLPYASVTDDTEQVLYLYRRYLKDKKVDAKATADCLRDWVLKTDAIQKKYIGPSSMEALEAIENGEPIEETGKKGTTCGGIMRTPAAVLFKACANDCELAENIYNCLLSTHNTSEALEAAGAYGFALNAALNGSTKREILDAALIGGRILRKKALLEHCTPSSVARIKWWAQHYKNCSIEMLLQELCGVFGTGLPSADVCGAVFAIFCKAGKDVWLAIRIGASCGGDTDTIAALSGALCCAYAGGDNIPTYIKNEIFERNSILWDTPWNHRI
jgi:ADP-ribosylglycohydrolase